MEDPRWLRLITIGLVLAALAVGYFLVTGKLSPSSLVKTGSEATPSASVLGQVAQGTATPSPKPTPASAYARIVSRNQNNVQTLPKTGFPQVLAGIFSVGVMISGWGLRKFPK